MKSSALIGGSAVFILLSSMVRNKFAALLIGPVGVGLLGTYQAIQEVVQTAAGLGLQTSAVRDVAKAAATGDAEAIGRTILALRRSCWVTGLLGALAMAVLAVPLSRFTFGTDEQAPNLALLGLVVFFQIIQGGQGALIRGMGRIADLARLNIVGAGVGLVVPVGFYAWLGLRGIVPALVLGGLVQLTASWYFARRIPVHKVEATWYESFRSAQGMMRLGIAIMWTGFLGSAVTYVIRALIAREISLEAVGIFVAALALSRTFVNFILAALEADYYPRLAAVSNDREAMTRLVNEQTEIGLLLAVPGLLLILGLAPWLIRIFYTSEFLPAADLLQWFSTGCLVQVASWPAGYVRLALGKGLLHASIQTVFSTLNLVVTWLGLVAFGLEGAAIAFFLLTWLGATIGFLIARNLIGFAWSAATGRLVVRLLPIVALSFAANRLLAPWPATGVGIAVAAAASVFCLRGLVQRVGPQHRIVRLACRVPGMRLACGL